MGLLQQLRQRIAPDDRLAALMEHHGDKAEADVGDFCVLDNRQAMLGKYRRHCVADASKVSVTRLEVWVRFVKGRVLKLGLRLS